MRPSNDPNYLRWQMVRCAQQHGVKPAAHAFAATPKTVRKWLRRWPAHGSAGLRELSRAPHHPARRIPPAQRRRAIELKRQLPSWGAARLQRDFQLPRSEKALRRIRQQEGLLRRKRRQHRSKGDLRAAKAAWRLFEQIELDTRNAILMAFRLDDIPPLWPQIRRLGWPLIQYTAREVVSGWQFLGSAQERSLACSTLLARLLIQHLQQGGGNLAGGRFQTDHGSEFSGSMQARQDSAFTPAVQSVTGWLQQTIPPSAHTGPADVETVHRLIEEEFYEVAAFSSRSDFLTKATSYLLWFNTLRKNSYKNYPSPWEILPLRDPSLPKQILPLPPLFLDQLHNKLLDLPAPGGYDLIPCP